MSAGTPLRGDLGRPIVAGGRCAREVRVQVWPRVVQERSLLSTAHEGTVRGRPHAD